MDISLPKHRVSSHRVSSHRAPTYRLRCKKFLLLLEGLMWSAGFVLLGGYALQLLERHYSSSLALQKFELAIAAHKTPQSARLQTFRAALPGVVPSRSFVAMRPTPRSLSTTPASSLPTQNTADLSLERNIVKPNQKLWSINRIREFEQAQASLAGTPLAVLQVPALSLTAPVYAGASEKNLKRGAAWVRSTQSLERSGNIGIAAHRDSFFRSLKNVTPGMTVELKTLKQTRQYTVTSIAVVDPSNIEVLAPTQDSRLTLITCYPFYFVGHAPQRYIVTAIEDEPVQSNL